LGVRNALAARANTAKLSLKRVFNADVQRMINFAGVSGAAWVSQENLNGAPRALFNASFAVTLVRWIRPPYEKSVVGSISDGLLQ